MTMKTRRSVTSKTMIRSMLAGLSALAALALPAAGMIATPGTAYAVIGRPFTPLSYAGVARRSSRRVARRTVARSSAYMTLPPGCIPTDATYSCGSTQYQQYYEGGNVVYVEAQP
jgi:hypothetical protein